MSKELTPVQALEEAKQKITSLETELAAEKAKVSAAESRESTLKAAVDAAGTKATADAATIAGLQSKNSELETRNTELSSRVTAQADNLEDLQEKLTTAEQATKDLKADFDVKVTQTAAARVLEITAGQGHSAVKAAHKSGTSGNAQSLLEQFNAIKDPKARAEFYAANKEGLLAGR